ncbi:H-2 class II histocompatibility antigen, E-S beta chain-like, partial [Lampris incognitus]|uniref:H-2 class II histocompatibility antigen, E-S beta chain-like n=1 Tax=Lampris incognitus TaxID=2546036 RepID=UPI0024B55382
LSLPDAFLHYDLFTCVFTSSELPDIEYIYSMNFNKIEYLRFNSTVGKYVGYTDHGIHNAERANNDPAEMARRRAEKERVCKPNVEIDYRAALDKTAEPSVRLTSVTPPSGRHPAMLMCSVYNFYPKYISVTWLRDGQPVTSDVTSTDELADGDWYYQIHSHLEYTPRSGEKITCMVEHASFPSPKKVDWNPSMPQSDRNKIAIGASGLLLGLILSLAGLIYYKRKAREEHLTHLRQLLKWLSAHGLIVNRVKCQFGLSSIDFLSHRVSPQGAVLLLVDAVASFPCPRT